ncbi:MAG: ATP-binding cassette domain-containing protein [Parcubacteria group bacterium]|jgi:branched-chain amino acid transport system permease protein
MLKIVDITRVKKITKSFGGDVAIQNCSFEVPEGKIVGLVGPNGGGKTTILNIICGIIKPDSGEIYLNNERIDNKSIEKRANLGIARSFQDSKLFNNLTVRENLLLAMEDSDTLFFKNIFGLNKISTEKEKKVEELLKLINFPDLINELVRDLSWGQRKLIDFLKTIIKPYSIALLDEPAAGIIPIFRQEKIGKLLAAEREKNKTILLIDHDLSFTFKYSDIILFMSEGRIIKSGTPEEIRKDKKIINTYIGK